MKGFKAIIVDDEIKLQQVLQNKLKVQCPSIEVVASVSDVDAAYNAIHTHTPDIVFLDIHLIEETGFDLLKRFTQLHFEVIFVTGFNDYVLDALQVSAVDYVLKPILNKKLIAAVDRAKKRLRHKERTDFYRNLVHNTHHLGRQSTKIAIPSADAYDFIQISDIIRCEGWDKYTRIHLKNGKEILSTYYLGIFKDMLASYNFYSPHKSHLINLNYISRYLKEGIVVMEDAAQVPVARRKREQFAKKVLDGFVLRRNEI
ncbi:MAG: LytTR family DNA-binding domain-containing protein [Bacteroidota bacterium]